MSAVEYRDWEHFQCPKCPEPFTSESWKLAHFVGLEALHADCCEGCPEIIDAPEEGESEDDWWGDDDE